MSTMTAETLAADTTPEGRIREALARSRHAEGMTFDCLRGYVPGVTLDVLRAALVGMVKRGEVIGQRSADPVVKVPVFRLA